MELKLGARIAIIVVAAIVLVVSITAIACSVIAHRVGDETQPVEDLSFWQSYIKDETLLKDVVIPGSHDAGTTGMPWYSETQDRDIAGQLACGTRYFDLRVKMKDGKARIYHGPAYSLYLEDILRDVRDFLAANPSECVILDVHKFGNPEAKTKTVELLDEYLVGKFVTKDEGKSDMEYMTALTLGQARGKCVLIWGDVDEYAENDARFFLRNDDHGDVEVGCLQSFYNSKWNWYYSSEKYIDKAIPAYINMYKESRGGLFVLQCQLTDGCLVCGPRYREGQHEKNMNAWTIAAYDSDELASINILMRDFVSPIKNCYTIMLNMSKGLVKAENIGEFDAIIGEVVNLTYGQR